MNVIFDPRARYYLIAKIYGFGVGYELSRTPGL